MPDGTQDELTLEVVASFHRQLMRLHHAGLRLQIDENGSVSHNLPERLNEIMAGMASETSKAKPLERVLRDAKYVPTRYRLALNSWHQCDQAVESLAILRAPVQQDSEGSFDLRYALLLPAIVIALVYGGSFYLLLVTVPKMEAIYLQLNEVPSLPVRCLLIVRQAMPFWGPALPIAGLAILWLIRSGRWNLPRWLPGRAQAARYLSDSLLAQNLAVQSAHSPVDDGAILASPDLRLSSTPAPAPMLRWAMGNGGDSGATADAVPMEQRARRLRLAANLYETMQSIRLQQFRGWLVFAASVFIGGGVTLAYSLALFVPLIQLLKDIVGR